MLCCDWDTIEAHYAFCTDFHGGQWSPEYARLCRLGRFFKPGRAWVGFKSLSDEGKAIYSGLVQAMTGKDEECCGECGVQMEADIYGTVRCSMCNNARYCPGCHEETDQGCDGESRCPACDGPCLCCYDGGIER
jgi:hypothetical protein